MTMMTPSGGPTVNDSVIDDAPENAIELREVEGLSQGKIVFRRFIRHRGAIAGFVVLILIALLALTSVGIGPIHGWWKYQPDPTYAIVNGGAPTLHLPHWLGGSGFSIGEHPWGQDDIGKDNFARVMKGTQVSLMIMVVIGIMVLVLGVVIGALAGYFGGWLGALLMRATDLVITLPVIVIGAVLGKLAGSYNGALMPFILALALGGITWTGMARLVRAEFLALRERDFVDAARVAGASDLRIMVKHILPNAMGVVIVQVTLIMAAAIVLETALSYLGFGVNPPHVSLGQLINQYQSSFATRPWLFWYPGFFIIVIALSVNFIGDGLRDAFDPRQKRIPSERAMQKSQGMVAAAASTQDDAAGGNG
jgi:peptide/nickel transport system permease protein